MTASTVLERVLSNKLENGWAIFKYNFKYAITRILSRGFFFVVTAVMTLTFAYSALKNHLTSYYIFTLVSAILMIVSGITILYVLLELLHSKKSMIVITNEGVIKNFKNKLEEYPFDNITNLNATNMYSDSIPGIARRGEQYIDFRDNRSGKTVNLTKNRIFGNPEPIFDILKSRVPGESIDTVRNNFHN